jgi:hypothetical protein
MPPAAISLSSWKEVQAALDSFPAPALTFGPEGDLEQATWVFRGLKSTEYDLEPRIERDSKGKSCAWPALESMQLLEFQSKAPMYMNAYELPDFEDKPSWLALMQHQGISTRLLDFSYSSYVALYMALRERNETERRVGVALWAIDATSITNLAEGVFLEAKREYLKHHAPSVRRNRRIPSLDPRFFRTDRDTYEGNHTAWRERTRAAVAPQDIVRSHFNEKGFVDLALPPVQNRRLSNQQGVFLVNGAEALTFRDSLFAMMAGQGGAWSKLYHVSSAALLEIEKKLFDMNIHELSMFPDGEGLAGFVRQKARLHFALQASATSGSGDGLR